MAAWIGRIGSAGPVIAEVAAAQKVREQTVVGIGRAFDRMGHGAAELYIEQVPHFAAGAAIPWRYLVGSVLGTTSRILVGRGWQTPSGKAHVLRAVH